MLSFYQADNGKTGFVGSGLDTFKKAEFEQLSKPYLLMEREKNQMTGRKRVKKCQILSQIGKW